MYFSISAVLIHHLTLFIERRQLVQVTQTGCVFVICLESVADVIEVQMDHDYMPLATDEDNNILSNNEVRQL